MIFETVFVFICSSVIYQLLQPSLLSSFLTYLYFYILVFYYLLYFVSLCCCCSLYIVVVLFILSLLFSILLQFLPCCHLSYDQRVLSDKVDQLSGNGAYSHFPNIGILHYAPLYHFYRSLCQNLPPV